METGKPDTELINTILRGIATGELDHNQSEYHCGTAHCIAGWVEVIKAKELGYSYTWFKEVEQPCFTKGDEELYEISPLMETTWQFAQRVLGLTPQEAAILFNVMSSFNQMCALLKILNSGRRIDTREKLSNFLDLYPSDSNPPSMKIYSHFLLSHAEPNL